MRRRTRTVGGWLVVGLVVGLSLTGCSGDGNKLTDDDVIAALQAEGYSADGAQCVLQGAKQQDVDLRSVFARDKATQHELDVVQSLGSYCGSQFGFTPPTSAGDLTGPTTVPVP
jgi:hypothetical protein